MTSGNLYFGYGSNLWIEQMHKRCPNSHFLGIARLPGWSWIINDRGYANVVQATTVSDSTLIRKPRRKDSVGSRSSEVWGLVFYLTADDEAKLDINEGVPVAYTKEMHQADFWPHRLTERQELIDVGAEVESKEMLVYVDRKRITRHKPKAEYVVRMNNGIRDALAFGVPASYINEVLRKFIPDHEGVVDEEVLQKAHRQAVGFRDEDGLGDL